MKMDQYRLNAYLSNSNEKNDEEKKQPLVHKPVFERISREPSSLEKQKEEEKTLENARLAAETGTWFEKRNVTKDDVLKSTDALIHKGLLKVPEDYVPEKESIYRRVAKFLVVIGMDEAARILPHLSEEQTERIIPEIARIRSVSEEEKKAVLEEFSALLEKSKEIGGVEKARDLLVKTYGSKKAEEILSKAVTFPEGNPFDFLKEASAERILLLLRGESDAVKSLVLSQLEPKKAAAIINSMEAKEKSSVILRLSKMQKVSPDVMI